ncbi:hypothetical protein Salpa_2255 [Sporomusa sp. KB1]|jgi:hypothetical protein|nr:hypothetical protein Salpa_2255 [Sporomusa sp. KB1]
MCLTCNIVTGEILAVGGIIYKGLQHSSWKWQPKFYWLVMYERINR